MSKRIDMSAEAKKEVTRTRLKREQEAKEMIEAAEAQGEAKISIEEFGKKKERRVKKEEHRAAQARQVAIDSGYPRIIAEIQKNRTQKIIISVNKYEGHTYVDLRIHFKDEKTGDYLPTRKGIAIKPMIGKQVVDAIVEGVNQIHAEEVIEEGKKNRENN
jgi:hypothetical protein